MKKNILIFNFIVGFYLLTGNLWADDAVIKFGSNNGSSNLTVQDSGTSMVTQMDSSGNVVTKGCVRIDSSGSECTTAENLVVDGKIGIGKTAPATVLDLSSTNSALRLTRLANASAISASNGMIAYDSGENELQAYINGTWADLSGNDFFVSKSGDTMSGSLVFSGVTSDITTIGSEHLVLAPGSGNVGIGRSAPRAVLELSSTTKTLLISNGNVGIGTTNPITPLQISGNFTSGALAGINSSPTFPSLSGAACSLGCYGSVGVLTLTSNQTNMAVVSGSVTASGGATTLTTANALFALTPTSSGTITNAYGLLLQDQGGAAISKAYGMYVEAQSGAVSNYAAIIAGGNVGVGYAAPGTVLAVNGNVGVGISVAAQRLIVSGGNIGIGYVAPGTALAVSGNIGIGVSVAAERLIVSGGNVGIGYTLPGTVLAVNGNVGIGKSTASEVLDVNGNIDATIFKMDFELKPADCGVNACTATATCTAGKVIVFGFAYDNGDTCDTNTAVCTTYCTVGQTSCAITGTASKHASVYAVCAKIN